MNKRNMGSPLRLHGSRCRSCLREFHTTQRLRQRLQYQPNGCFVHLTGVLFPLTSEEVLEVSTTRQKGAGYRIPPVRLPGPRLPDRAEWKRICPARAFPDIVQPPSDVDSALDCDLLDWLINVVPWNSPAAWAWPAHLSRTPHAVHHLNDILDHAEAWLPQVPVLVLQAFRQCLLCQDNVEPSKDISGPVTRSSIIFYGGAGHYRERWEPAARLLSRTYNLDFDLIDVTEEISAAASYSALAEIGRAHV